MNVGEMYGWTDKQGLDNEGWGDGWMGVRWMRTGKERMVGGGTGGEEARGWVGGEN